MTSSVLGCLWSSGTVKYGVVLITGTTTMTMTVSTNTKLHKIPALDRWTCG